MVKVISRPSITKRVVCQTCGAMLSYDLNEDVEEEFDYEDSWTTKEGYYYLIRHRYITCPDCGCDVHVGDSVEKRFCR